MLYEKIMSSSAERRRKKYGSIFLRAVLSNKAKNARNNLFVNANLSGLKLSAKKP